MKRIILIPAIALVIASAMDAEVLQVEIPAQTQWCRTATVNIEEMILPGRYEETLRRNIKPLEECGRSRNLTAIGIPYVAATTLNADAVPPNAEITLCATVPAAADSCDAIARRTTQSVKMLTVVCREDQVENCRDQLTAVLRGDPWRLDDAAIQALSWRIAQAKSDAPTAANVIGSLIATDGQVLRSADQTETARAPVRSASVVVAVPMPSPPAPPEVAPNQRVP